MNGEHQMARMGERRTSSEVGFNSRFEIVRTDADQPWHARFVAVNGEPVWSTENHPRREDALHAIEVLIEATSVLVNGGGVLAMDRGISESDHPFFTVDGFTASPHIVDVDERTAAGS